MSCTGVQDRSDRRDRNNHLSNKERFKAALERSAGNPTGQKPYWWYLLEDPTREEAPAKGNCLVFDEPAELVKCAKHLETIGFQGPSFGMDGYFQYAKTRQRDAA